LEKPGYFELLGRALFGSSYSKRKRFSMMVSYLDESEGAEPLRAMVIAGWSATIEQWEGFEVDWKLFLISYRVPYLHMKQFAHSVGPYKKWKDRPVIRKKFLAEASEIIRSRVQHGFMCSIHGSHFQLVNELFELEPVFSSPYALAGRFCMQMIRDWQKKKSLDVLGMKHVFHDDGPDKGGLIAAMRNFEPFFPIPSFEADHDWKPSNNWPDGRKGLVQLQAADFLAYEFSKTITDRLQKHIRAGRKSLVSLLRKNLTVNMVNQRYLLDLCFERGIKKRLPEDSAIYTALNMRRDRLGT
jgi:hypothetical protein